MKKYFVISDVHGFYNEMKAALDKAGFDLTNPDHILVSLGDLLDRGRQPKECLEFVLGIPEDRRILIRGNHEDLMWEMVASGAIHSYDHSNGTVQTAMDLTGEKFPAIAIMDLTLSTDLWWRYYDSTIDYAEIGDYVFVHGWVPLAYKVQMKLSETPSLVLKDDWREGDWKEARWYCGMSMWNDGLVPEGKTVVCGHWHTSWGHHFINGDGEEYGDNAKFTPFIDKGIIALDACTAYSGFCNCVVLEIDDGKDRINA